MAPELVAGGGYGGLIWEKPYCAPDEPDESDSATLVAAHLQVD